MRCGLHRSRQDLRDERNGLEAQVQAVSKNPSFVSVTPQRQMDYNIDLSKYVDDDEDVSDDAAENGMLLLEMTDDTDIDPQVLIHSYIYIYIAIMRVYYMYKYMDICDDI